MIILPVFCIVYVNYHIYIFSFSPSSVINTPLIYFFSRWILLHCFSYRNVAFFPVQLFTNEQEKLDLILFPIFLKLAPSLQTAIPFSKHSSVTCHKVIMKNINNSKQHLKIIHFLYWCMHNMKYSHIKSWFKQLQSPDR